MRHLCFWIIIFHPQEDFLNSNISHIYGCIRSRKRIAELLMCNIIINGKAIYLCNKSEESTECLRKIALSKHPPVYDLQELSR